LEESGKQDVHNVLEVDNAKKTRLRRKNAYQSDMMMIVEQESLGAVTDKAILS